MPTNRSQYLALNRHIVTDEEARQHQKRLDAYINEAFTDVMHAPLVRGPIRVNNNVFTGLFRVFRVMPGCAVVVTGDGRVLETLYEGSYNALSFPVMKRIDLYVVNVRERTLNIETTQEFILNYIAPNGLEVPVTVDLNVAVSYQVVTPELVALQVEQPLTRLYDVVLESIRSIINHTRYRDFQAGGQAGYAILQQLKQRRVKESLGIELSNVQITSLRGNHLIDQAIQDGFHDVTQAQTRATVGGIETNALLDRQIKEAAARRDIAKLIDLTPEYVLQYHPEMYTRLFGDPAQTEAVRLQALIELAKAGVVNPTSLTGGSSEDLVRQLLGGASAPSSQAHQMIQAYQHSPHPVSFQSISAIDRITEEVELLQQSGLPVKMKSDPQSYYITITLNDPDGHVLTIYFVCTSNYPYQAPNMLVEYDGIEQRYNPDSLRNWTAQNSLLQLVDSVVTAYS